MSLRETLETIRNGPTPGNEESAKMWIMAPILQDLGWRPFDIQWEYKVGRSKGRVDAALMGEKGAAAFIEAKAPGSRLDDHVEQVLGYAFQEGANICALTTGLEWWLYLPAETGYNFDERRFAELRLKDDPVEQLATDFAAFLGKEPLLDGEAEKKAKQVLKARREAEHLDKEVPGIWREMLDAPDEELIELVSKRVYEKTNLRPTPQQVTSALKGSPTPPSVRTPRFAVTSRGARRGSQPKPTTEKKKVTSGSTTEAKKTREIAKGFELLGQYYEVKYNYQVLVGVAEVLLERHGSDFERALELRGIERNPEVTKQNRYSEVKSSGIFVRISEGNYWARSYQLVEHFGHQKNNLKIDTEEKKAFAKSVRPVRIELFGQSIEVKLWKEVIMRLADVLYERHSSEFDRVLKFGTEKNPYASRSPEMLWSAYKVGDSDIFIESGIGSDNIKKHAKKFLKEFGYQPEDLEILFE